MNVLLVFLVFLYTSSVGRDRGIFLITTLLLVLVVTMILGATIKLVPTSLQSASTFADNEKALAAAQAGIRYAVARLQSDFNWQGGTGNNTVVNQNGLIVIEDEGNIFGFLTSPGGDVSQFRLRFNYQDGNPGLDSRPDPTQIVRHPYLSVNNLTNYGAGLDVPQSNGAPNFDVPAAPPTVFQVPRREVLLVVEGLAGDGLRDTDPANPDPPAGDNRRVSRRYVEAIYSQDSNAGGDSVLSGGGSIDVRLTGGGKSTVELESASAEDVRVRAYDNLTVIGGGATNVEAKKGDQGLMTYGTLGTGTFSEDAKTVQRKTVDSPALMSLEFGSLTLPDSSPTSTTAAQIKAGIYYWNESASQMEWFDADYATGWVPPGPGLVVDSSFSAVNTGASNISWTNEKGSGKGKGKNTAPMITVDGDVNVQASLYATGTYFVSEDPSTVTYEFNFEAPKNSVNTFYSSGDFYVQGPLQGKGTSIIAGKDLVMENGGINLTLDPGAESGVNLYAKGNIEISTFTGKGSGKGKGSSGAFGDLKLAGLVFAWGDFEALLDDPLGPVGGGKFEVTGALTAFGGDPASQNPGDNGQGDILVWADEAKLKYDPAFANGVTGATSGDLTKVSWTVY